MKQGDIKVIMVKDLSRLGRDYIGVGDYINNRKSPIQDDYIEKYLAEKELNLTATLDAKPIIIETQRFEDFRGWLSASAEEFHGVQINQGFSKKAGTLRGLHFQEGKHHNHAAVHTDNNSLFSFITVQQQAMNFRVCRGR